MGTWEMGPFDNDAAADLRSDVAAAGDARSVAEIVRSVLTLAADAEDYLELDDGQAAIAAAAILGRQVSPDGLPDWEGAPEADAVEIPTSDLAGLSVVAVQALDRVVAEHSEWRAEWEASEEWTMMVELVSQLRTALASFVGPSHQ